MIPWPRGTFSWGLFVGDMLAGVDKGTAKQDFRKQSKNLI